MKLSANLAIAGALLAGVDAHGGVVSYTIVGKAYPGNLGQGNGASIQRGWKTIDPLLNMNAVTMRCNNDGRAHANSATVSAGSQVVAKYNNWPHPHGPLIVWMAKCPGQCKNYDGSGATWFKIDEVGLTSGTLNGGQWGLGRVVGDGKTWTTTIPSTLAAGEYLLRHELVSLHDPGKPQFYPQCAQLIITGSGTVTPPLNYLTSIPGVYKSNDPSLNINIYSSQGQQTSWKPIGPPVWRG